MASRPIFSPYQVIINGDMSQSTVTSAVTIIQNLSQIGYDISWAGGSGATAGTFAVQVSNTYSQKADGTVANAGNWTTLTLSNVPTVSSSSGNGYIDIDAISAFAMRLVYTRSGGAGTLQATVCGKVA
jgi:hypothetical protein